MTTFSDGVFQYNGAILGSSLPIQVGKSIFVRPRTGSDTNSGRNPSDAIKTLEKALDLATENQNDVVYLIEEGLDATQTTTLDWNKDRVHLIGINSQAMLRPGSRITLSPVVHDLPILMLVSANNCYVANISVHHADIVNTLNGPIAMKIVGGNNNFQNCWFSGGNDPSMDHPGTRSLVLSGATAQNNYFQHCSIGTETSLGTTGNALIEFLEGVGPTIFKDCLIFGNAATQNLTFVTAAEEAAYQGPVWFTDCAFLNQLNIGAEVMTEAFNIDPVVNNIPGGIVLHNTLLNGVQNWFAENTSAIKILGFGLSASTIGFAIDVGAI